MTRKPKTYIGHSLNSSKGVLSGVTKGIIQGTTTGVIEGDTRSFDYSLHKPKSLCTPSWFGISIQQGEETHIFKRTHKHGKVGFGRCERLKP